MKAEFDRVASRQPMDTLSMKRYELPTPPAGKMTDVAAWNECVDNSMAQLEHQRTRITNLELMSEYGCESWKVMYFVKMLKDIFYIKLIYQKISIVHAIICYSFGFIYRFTMKYWQIWQKGRKNNLKILKKTFKK